MRRIGKYLRILCAITLLINCGPAIASEHHGQVVFNGTPVPGATVTATQGDKKIVAVTDQQGLYSFPDLTEGTWTIEIDMVGFSPIQYQAVTGPNAPPPPAWELKMLPLDQIKAETNVAVPAPAAAPAAAAPQTPNGQTKPPDKNQPTTPPVQPGQTKPPQTNAPEAPKPAEETDQRASDGFLINGSSNNGAASPFAQLAAFGNSRNNGKSLYNGGIGLIYGNSALNASPYSLSGFTAPKPNTNQVTGVANLGGPLNIPHIMKKGPFFFVGYQWQRNGMNATVPGIVPTMAERMGIFSQTIINPVTGLPFPSNTVPISSQAQSLLNLYPMPNLVGSPVYNYQAPIVSNTHQDAMQSRLTKTFNRKDSLNGGFGFQDTRTSSPNLFNFLDTTDTLGIQTSATWNHNYNQHFRQTITYTYNRYATQTIPYWENRENISGEAGITGNNQDPMNWGPPTLQFLQSNIYPLSDGIAAHNRFQTSSLGYSLQWFRRNHNITVGGDFRRQESNYLSQQDPRGIFQFNGDATAEFVGGVAQPNTGSDFADFLLGIPDTSQIAFGNADKYFRQSVYDAYVDDDWRVNPQLSVHVGLRWEYGAPITELFGRLVSLDITPGFTDESAVLASNPVGSLTGQNYPTSLVRPDKHGIEPRLSFAWRPISGSSIVVRGGYSINYDTSVYRNIALLMAQQSPLSTSLNVANSAACPLTLANGFSPCSSVTADNFAIDPNFRVGYVQTWQLSVQRDLPWSLQMTATYLGNKGTRGPQEFLPNTYPDEAPNPCPTCPAGYAFLTSNGNSHLEKGSLQVRRRLHNGLTVTVMYTFAKSIDDDAAMGGQLTTNPIVAQNWLNLSGERGLSTFDQRQLLTIMPLQYTTGMGIGGKTLMSGWKGQIYKEWTFLNNVTIGTGLPETPYLPSTLGVTGFTDALRPELTGLPLYAGLPAGFYVNSAAYTLPPSGQFGNAGRDSITGPPVFTYNASLARTFRLNDRLNLDVRFDSTNPINHVTFSSYGNIFGNSVFGTPISPNPMRSITSTMRLRF